MRVCGKQQQCYLMIVWLCFLYLISRSVCSLLPQGMWFLSPWMGLNSTGSSYSQQKPAEAFGSAQLSEDDTPSIKPNNSDLYHDSFRVCYRQCFAISDILEIEITYRLAGRTHTFDTLIPQSLILLAALQLFLL